MGTRYFNIFNEKLKTKLSTCYQWTNQRICGVLDILRTAIHHFNQMRGSEAAASVAYYAIFSLFPLLLFLIAIVGFLLVNVEAPGEVLDFATLIFPASRQFIQDNLLDILKQRGTGGIIGLIGLVWAASEIFITLARHINRAWPGANTRNFLQGRLIGLAMVGILTLLLFLSLITSVIIDLLTRLELPIHWTTSIYDNIFWSAISSVFSWLIAFSIFLVLYRWIPNTKVKWAEAFWGAIVATIAWKVATLAFSWYLRSGFARFEIVYGSLGTVVALLAWIYLTSTITIFGAHISAVVAQKTRSEERTVQV